MLKVVLLLKGEPAPGSILEPVFFQYCSLCFFLSTVTTVSVPIETTSTSWCCHHYVSLLGDRKSSWCAVPVLQAECFASTCSDMTWAPSSTCLRVSYKICGKLQIWVGVFFQQRLSSWFVECTTSAGLFWQVFSPELQSSASPSETLWESWEIPGWPERINADINALSSTLAYTLMSSIARSTLRCLQSVSFYKQDLSEKRFIKWTKSIDGSFIKDLGSCSYFYDLIAHVSSGSNCLKWQRLLFVTLKRGYIEVTCIKTSLMYGKRWIDLTERKAKTTNRHVA